KWRFNISKEIMQLEYILSLPEDLTLFLEKRLDIVYKDTMFEDNKYTYYLKVANRKGFHSYYFKIIARADSAPKLREIMTDGIRRFHQLRVQFSQLKRRPI